jgi:transposase
MDWWTKIRLEVLRGERSKREILRREGIHWETLKKILEYSEPPGYRMKRSRPKPKIGPYLGQIAQIIEEDKALPKKQRHTAKRIYERIKEMGYGGKYTQAKEAVREIKRLRQEVFMPLDHDPGEAQVDLGYALAKVGGVLRKVAFFVMVLPHSDAFFVMAFERECTESYWEGHVRAFEFFGGVAQRISYDNSRVLVSKIVGPHERKPTDGFLKLQSHYLFREHFCRVRRPNEKGVVEGVVKFARLNFFVPVPQVEDLEALNRRLAEMCREDMKRLFAARAEPKRSSCLKIRRPFCHCLRLLLMPAESSPPGRTHCRWSALTTMTIQSRWSMPITISWSKATWIAWSCAIGRSWLNIGASGARRGSFSITCIISPCWNESQAHWITPGRRPT